MTDIVRICIVLIIILVLLRRKLGVGYVLLIASVFLMAFYAMGASSIEDTIIATVSAPITIKLLFALSFIRMFELITRENNVLQRMMESIKGTLRHKKSVIVSMPMLIGMLPSVGGAYFSAPMVDEATQGVDMTAEEKAFANYWYRHPWEYILPLYPGIILASAITRVEVRTFIILNFAYALAMIVVGNFYGLGKAKGGFGAGEPISKKGMFSFIPIILLLLLVMAFGMELHYALLIVTALLILFYRYGLKDIVRITKHGLSKDVFLLILGVILFKETLEHSGAVQNLSNYFTFLSIPLLPLVFILPFAVGILTGITVGAVGATFPLIASISGSDPAVLSFAFAAGFVGVLLSPVHVCLVLTREYFKADGWKVYKMLFPSSGFIVVVAILEYIVVKYF